MTTTAHAATPADFDAYWDALDAELARYPAAPELEPLPLPLSTDFRPVYALRLTSIGPYRIFGYYSVPTGRRPVPRPAARRRATAASTTCRTTTTASATPSLVLMHRGQRLADQPFAATYPGLLTLRHRRPGHATSTGASWPTACAAPSSCWPPGGRHVAYRHRRRRPGADHGGAPPALQRRPAQRRTCSTGWPRPVAAPTPTRPRRSTTTCAPTPTVPRPSSGRWPTSARALTHRASRRRRSSPWATPGTIGGPEWLAPLAAALGGPVDQYALTHAGGTDHEAQDAWLAGELGVQPMVKFRREYV